MKPALVLLATVMAMPAIADDHIVTDSPVVQSLVAQVTGDLPTALLSPGADPHHFTLRPSQLRALAEAEWLIWIGPDFSPWLDDDARKINANMSELRLGEADPHGWLDPVIAQSWAEEIIKSTGGAGGVDFSDLEAELRGSLAGLDNVPLIVGHDAYGSFARRFGLSIAGAISDGHAATPGAAHLSELREMIAAGEVGCVVSDSHEIEGYVDVITEGYDVQVVELDLSGAGLTPGPEFYPDLMRRAVSQLATCVD